MLLTDRTRSWAAISPLAGAVFGVVLAVVVAAIAVCHIRGADYGVLSRDPVQVAGIRFYTGYLSSFSAVVMCTAATACFFAATAVPARRRDAVGRNFLLACGSLTAFIMADDLFLLHERLFPMWLGIPENVVMVFHAVALATVLVYYRAQLLRTRLLPLLVAVACFGAAQLADIVLRRSTPYVLEDAPKLVGYGAWCGYFLDTSFTRVRDAVAATGKATNDPSHDSLPRRGTSTAAAGAGPAAERPYVVR